MRWGMLIGTVYAYVWLLLQIRQSWIPYLLGHTRLHDDFTWYHDHGYAETLKVLALIGECRPPARGLATALSAGDSNGDNRLLQDLAADIRRIVSTEELRMMAVTCSAWRAWRLTPPAKPVALLFTRPGPTRN
jgi:hypothetical protein